MSTTKQLERAGIFRAPSQQQDHQTTRFFFHVKQINTWGNPQSPYSQSLKAAFRLHGEWNGNGRQSLRFRTIEFQIMGRLSDQGFY